MKWYWIVLIVVALIAIGILIAKAVSNKKSASSPAITKTVINTPASTTTDKPAATQTTVTV